MSQVLKPKKGYKKVNLGGQIHVQIPEMWNVSTLEDISDNGTQNGLAISTSDYGKGTPIVGMTKFYASEILTDDNMKEVVISKKNKDRFSLKSFDLLFGRRSMDGRATGEAGKCVIVSNIKTPVVFESSVIRMSIKKEHNPFFIYQLFKSTLGKRIRIRIIRVSAVSGISSGDLKKIKIPIPSKTEQDNIASILSNIDNLITNTHKIIDQTRSLKTGLIQKLLTRGINHTKFKKTKWYFGKEIEIPKEWEVLELRRLCKVRQGLQIPISDRFNESGTNRFQYITVKSIHSNEFNEYIENPNNRVICTENDILFTRTGNTGEIITNIKGVFHNNFFLVDFDKIKLFKNYLVISLKQHKIQGIIRSLAGITTIPDLNHKDFFRLRITVPPILEQQKIASILSDIDSQIQSQTQYKEKLEKLKKSLMQKLLTGQVSVTA